MNRNPTELERIYNFGAHMAKAVVAVYPEPLGALEVMVADVIEQTYSPEEYEQRLRYLMDGVGRQLANRRMKRA